MELSQKFGKLKKASESETGVTAISIAPAATTPPVTPQSKKRNTGGTGERKRKAVATLDNTGHMKRKKPNGVKSEPTDDEQSEPDEQGPNHNAVDGEAQNGDPITESHPIANGTDEEDAENGASVTGDGVTLEVDADGTNGIKVEDEADDELED